MRETFFSGITMEYPDSQFRLSTDSVLLADFVRLRHRSRICDLGCGCGAISLMLLGRDRDLYITGVELQPQAAQCAEENARKNGLEDRLRVVQGDLREHRTLLGANGFDIIVSNPPYYPVNSGLAGSLTSQRSEETCALEDLAQAAAWLLRFGGSFCVVHKPERLCDLMCALRQWKLEPKRIRFVRSRPGADISLVLLESRLGAGVGLRYEPDLILRDENGEESEEYKRIYHR